MAKLEFPVVGIGASAGGVEALDAFFRGVPADPGMAFVVITHLARTRDSVLPEIISRRTKMSVKAAADDELLEQGHVYVLPPGSHLTIEEGRLHLHEVGDADRVRNPVDVFFGSLAQDQGDGAVGVILSGAGHDGALGIKAINEAGGLTLAQGNDHSRPSYDGMPSSAISSGGVDLVVPVEEMGQRIADILHAGAASKASQSEGEQTLAPPQKSEICDLLQKQSGHDFSGYKDKTFSRRVYRRMQIVNCGSLADYVDLLRRDGKELNLLFRGLLIGVTKFFRDADAFAVLEEKIPMLFQKKNAGDEVRIWVPGCASGEEVYSIAILILEYLEKTGGTTNVRVFATDIDEDAINIARAGIYPPALVDGIDAERLKRFFVSTGPNYVISKSVREMCIFSAHSVIKDPPFSKIDLISCRNMLIYMSMELQQQVIPIFHFALRSEGLLFLGTSENISKHSDLFAPLDKKQRLFQRRDHGSLARPLPLFLQGHRSPRSSFTGRPVSDLASMRGTAELRLLERHAPAHVVVNRDGDVIHFSARTGKYLEAPSGAPNRQLLSLVRQGLRLEIRSAFQAAVEGKSPIHRKRIPIEVEDRTQLIDLVIEKLPGHDTDPLFLVIFKDVGAAFSKDEARTQETGSTVEAFEQVQHELQETRERLQSVVEEYETSLEELKSSNEELVSLNEELQSTNEEHETSKEELQSVNEELRTVNTELSDNIEALDRANSDLRHLFESTSIATIFLDKDLNIRSLTPAVSQVFNVIPGDFGRPLTDITSALDLKDLRADIDHVWETGAPVERSVSKTDGTAHYLMRVLPYRRSDKHIHGVVVTFVDVTPLVDAEAHQRTLIEELNHRVKNMLTVVTALANQTIRTYPQPEDFRSIFIGRIEALAKIYQLISRDRWTQVELCELVEAGVEPFNFRDGSIAIEGPPLSLTPKAALALGLVVHELTTNTLKYGALSVPAGHVSISWEIRTAGAEEWLVVNWQESGGPSVAKPTRKGFGTVLIERELKHELSGKAAMRYAAEGFMATFKIPWTPELIHSPAH